MYNAIDFYGSFLGIKQNFISEISDDIDILDDSDFFHKNLNILFKLSTSASSFLDIPSLVISRSISV